MMEQVTCLADTMVHIQDLICEEQPAAILHSYYRVLSKSSFSVC